MKLRPHVWMTLILFIAAAVAPTSTSAGTFPGANGKITFSHCDVDVINPDGTGLSILAEATPAGCYAEPAWNAAGTKLAYLDARTIRSMNADGSNDEALYSHDTFAGNPTWSANGSVVAFDGFIDTVEGSRIFVVPAAGGTATELSAVNAQDPTYSPDGAKLAFEDDATNGIGVMNADGSNAASITSGAFGSDGDFDPSWSPDGTKIAFQRQKQIWTMDADGTGATQLTTGADASHPTWSPDGTRIAFARADDVWVMEADGSDVTNITAGIHQGERRPPEAPDWGATEAPVPPPPGEGIEFSVDAYQVDEGLGNAATARKVRGAVITVVRTGDSAGSANMLFETSDGTAKSSTSKKCRLCKVPDADYLKASGTLVFGEGETTKTFVVPIVDDGVVEGDETVNLILRRQRGRGRLRPGPNPGPRSTAVLTISDNDPNVSFERAASSAPEGDAVRLNVLLSSPVGGATVDYSVTGGTATARGDFTLAAGTLGFSGRGPSGATIPLRLIDDDLKEEAETVVVELSAPTNVELGAFTIHTFTIEDDDPNGDVAGGTTATALPVDLIRQPRQAIIESLAPQNSDVDVYRVNLEAGDELAIDVDPKGHIDFDGDVIAGLTSSTLTIIGPDGTTELAVVGASDEPNGSGPSDNPAHLFTAATAGDHYLRLSTEGASGLYRLELHRIALAEGKQDPALLDDEGPMFAWLRGDTLGITGPTGYGFALVGNWTQEIATEGSGRRGSLATATYALAAGEIVTVRSVLGDLSVPVVEDIRFSTTANRWGDVFGQVEGSIPTRIGVPLGEFASEATDVFGFFFELGTGAEIDDWKILLGSDITASSLGEARNIGEVAQGAPYFLSVARPPFRIKFGPIDTEALADQRATVLILDPADPFFYVNWEDQGQKFVVALSSQGFIPFHPELPPKRSPGVGLTDFYSQTFSSTSGPIFALFKGAELQLDTGRVIDIDANDDGSLLAGNGNADQLFRGDLSALVDVMRDINVGANAKVILSLGQGPLSLEVPLGRASAVYNGQREAIWFRGTKGVENPFGGTPFRFLTMTSQDEIEGTIFSDGRFDVAAETRVELLDAGSLILQLHLDNQGIDADVTGEIELEAKASIDTKLFGKVSARCEMNGDARGRFSFSSSGGNLHMSGSLRNDGSIKCYYKGKKIGSASFNVSGEIDNGRIVFKIPYIGEESIRLF